MTKRLVLLVVALGLLTPAAHADTAARAVMVKLG